MKRLALALLTTMAMGGAALAEQPSTQPGATTHDMQKTDKMKGPPNAGGGRTDTGTPDTTGTAGGGAAAAKATGEADKSGEKK